MHLLRRRDYKHQQLTSDITGETYSLSAVLSTKLQCQDFFIHHEILSPGKRSSAQHSHSNTEEIIYVLSGAPTAVEGTERTELTTGDCVCFHRNSPPHTLENNSSTPAEFLVLSRNLAKSDATN